MARIWLKMQLFTTVLVAITLVLLGPAPADALSAGDDHNSDMVDIDTPVYVGYDSALHAYHFFVTGRWRSVCDSNFCWPPIYDGNPNDLGSNDAVRIRFSDSVQFKKFQIRTYDACGDLQKYAETTLNSDSFDNAYAGVDDKVFVGYKRTVTNGNAVESGTCKLATEPISGVAAGGSGGSGSVTWWADLAARSFKYDVWVNPAPSQGNCYDRLYVKGGYTHTWTSDSVGWSIGYPWGVGLGPVSGNGHFTVFQGSDGIPDPDLTTPQLCRH